jgi:hypothetical protein
MQRRQAISDSQIILSKNPAHLYILSRSNNLLFMKAALICVSRCIVTAPMTERGFIMRIQA